MTAVLSIEAENKFAFTTFSMLCMNLFIESSVALPVLFKLEFSRMLAPFVLIAAEFVPILIPLNITLLAVVSKADSTLYMLVLIAAEFVPILIPLNITLLMFVSKAVLTLIMLVLILAEFVPIFIPLNKILLALVSKAVSTLCILVLIVAEFKSIDIEFYMIAAVFALMEFESASIIAGFVLTI